MPQASPRPTPVSSTDRCAGSAAARTVLTVCRTCRPEGAPPGDEPAGAALSRAAAAALRGLDADGAVAIQAIACLSACSRACTASVAADGKFGYVIGGLSPEDAADLATFALRHSESPDGIPAWRSRPEKIRKNTLARLPPTGGVHALIEPVTETDASGALDEVQEGA